MARNRSPNKKEGGINLRSTSARISGSKVIGRDNIEGLTGKDVNRIIGTLLKYFPKVYLQNPDELDKTLADFRRFHEQLHEYKELHNAINEILVSFEPFKAQVTKAGAPGDRPKLGELRILWRPVSLSVGSLLKWAQTINHIGKPFKEFDDKRKSGEEWAIQFCDLKNSIDGHFSIHQTSLQQTYYPITRYFFALRRQRYEAQWWDILIELTGSFSHTSSYFMNSADKQLRLTAQELFNLSNKALDGYQLR